MRKTWIKNKTKIHFTVNRQEDMLKTTWEPGALNFGPAYSLIHCETLKKLHKLLEFHFSHVKNDEISLMIF